MKYTNKNGVEFEIEVSSGPFPLKNAWGFSIHVVNPKSGFAHTYKAGVLRSLCQTENDAIAVANGKMMDYVKRVYLDSYDIDTQSHELYFPEPESDGWYVI